MRKLTRAVRWGAPLGVLAFCLPSASMAQETGQPTQEERVQERVHEVRKQDTLWDLAQHYYNNPFLWEIIYQANLDVVEDPHWIYPAERLVIPGLPLARTRDAAPVAAVQPADTVAFLGEPVVEPPPPPRAPRRLVRTRFYLDAPEAEGPTVLETLGPVAVQPGEYYSAPWLDRWNSIPAIAEMLRVNDPDAGEIGAITPTARPFDEIFLGYVSDGRAAEIGERLLLVSRGPNVRGGTVIQPAAIITVRAVDDQVITAVVTEQFGPVEAGARALVLERFSMIPGERARPVADGGDGAILAFPTEQMLYSTTDHAFINLGASHGLRIGDELVAYVPPTRAERGHTLPPEPVARLRVVRVQDETATALVVRTVHGVLAPGMPIRVIAEMP